MRKLFTLLILLILFSSIKLQAQLTGTKTIPGDYATIAAAITDINTVGVGSGGVTFNIAASYAESITAPLQITATGTASNPIVFQVNPSTSGSNPLVTRTDAGSNVTTTIGGQGDAIFIIDGGDYITFDKIDITASLSDIEYGYYLRRASVTDGCKNVTIKNCVITMNKGTSAYVVGIYSSNNDATSLVSSASGITLTSTGGRTENLTITGNTIQNVFSGIIARGFAASTPYDFYDQNLVIGADRAGNTIQNFAGNTASASYGVYMIYQTSPNVSYNNIDNARGGANATSTLYGIFMSSSSAAGAFVANNNSITLGQGATSAAHCIYDGQTGISITINNNLFSYGTFASTTTSYLIYCNNSTPNITIDGNAISGTITKTGAGQLEGYYNYGGPSGGTITINNNNFSNITLTGASAFYGIRHYTSTSQIMIITNNIVSNITGGTSSVYGIYQGYGATGNIISGNNVFSISSAGTIYGLYCGASNASTSLSVYNNNIYNLSSTGASTVYGLYSYLGTNNKIYKNKIYNLVANNASGIVYGMQIAGSTATYIYNNFISDLRTPITSNVDAIRGIYVSSTTSNSTIGLYYNTIYLNASSTGTNFGTTGIYHTYNATATTAVLDMRNNIICNNSTPNGTGLTVALRRSAATSLANYGSNSNNNAFYAGATEDATHAIYYDGATYYSMAGFKTLATPRESASFRELPPFSNIATTPYNLHLSTATGTQCESGAVVMTTPVAITDDYDGDVRNTSTPDIGADEGAFSLLDLVGPVITYTALGHTGSTANRTFSNVVISDATGVNVTTAKPRLYYKKSTNANVFGGNTSTDDGWKWVEASGTTSPFSFTFDYSLLLGGSASIGDVIQYFVVAQDVIATPNVTANPSAGFVGTSVSSITSAPTTPNSYNIGALSGTFLVGAGQTSPNYATLTAAIADLNSKEMTGPVTFLLTDATYSTSETFPVVINSNPGSSATNVLTIKPNASVTSAITGAAANGQLFLVKNNYTVIDGSNTSGGTTRDLTITNTSTTTPQVVLVGSTGTTPITNVALKNCIVINGVNTSTPIIVRGSDGNAGYFNNITIQNNSVNTAYIGIYCFAVVASGNGNGLLITGNDLNSTTTPVRYVGIYVQGVDGATISNNMIGNFDKTSGEDDRGIWLATGTINSNVFNNKIYSLGYTGTSGYGSYGVTISTATTNANVSVYNNFIYDISGDGWDYTTTLGDNPIGIYAFSAQSGIKLYYNSINLYGSTLNQTNALSCGIALGTGTVAEIINNNIVNNLGLSSSTGLGSCAIYAQTDNAQFSTINYNNYYVNPSGSGAKIIGKISTTTTALNLTEWQTATTQDANSVSGDPKFETNTNLHIQTSVITPVSNAGVQIAAVTTDIDGDTRNNPSDIGADEYTYAPPAVNDPTGVTATAISATQIDIAFTPNASSNNVLIVWNLTGTFTAPTGTPPAVGEAFAGGTLIYNGLTSPFNHTGITANRTYYYKVYSYDGASCSPGVTANATTPCATISTFPWTESFSSTLPECWSYSEGASGASYHWAPTTADATHGVSGPQSGTHFMYLYVYYADTDYNPYYLTTPSVALGATPRQIKYYYFLGASGYTTTPVPLTLQISTDGGSSWTDLYAHTSSNSTFSSTNALTGWTQNTVDLSTYTNQTVIFRFASNSNYGSNICDQGLDEIVIEDLPSCLPPSALTATSITSNSASLGWTENGTAILWNIELGTFGFTPTGTPTRSGVTNPYTYTELTPSTQYSYYVQADCGSGSTSTWTGPYSFTTACASQSLPWSENFDAVTIPALPSCWAITSGSGWVTTNNANTTYDADAHSGTQFLRESWTATNEYVWTPGFDLTAGTAYNFSFWWAGDGYADWVGDIFYNTTQDATGATQLGASFVDALTTTTTTYAQVTRAFTPSSSGTYYFATRVNEATGSPWYLSFDDFSLEVAPTTKTLNLKLYLEGLYAGAGIMNQAMDDLGAHYLAPIADKVTVKLHDATDYATVVGTYADQDLNTDGTCSVTTIPGANNGNYYISVHSRNHLETVSASTVSFAGSTIPYDFSTADSQAYGSGSNMKNFSGVYAFWGGDVSQDGFVDSGDMTPVDNDATNFVNAWSDNDVNGDGFVDSADMTIIDNNATNFISAQTP